MFQCLRKCMPATICGEQLRSQFFVKFSIWWHMIVWEFVACADTLCESILDFLPTMTDVGQNKLLRKQFTNCNILPPAERMKTRWRSRHKPDLLWPPCSSSVWIPLRIQRLTPRKYFQINVFTIQGSYGSWLCVKSQIELLSELFCQFLNVLPCFSLPTNLFSYMK